jgi:MFS family permease
MNDALGRRVPLLAAGALCTVAALLGMTTDTFWWLLCVRCLFGIGMGINKCAVPPAPP